MKVAYLIALLMIVLMVGCATEEAPPAEPAAPAEAPAEPAAPAEGEVVAEAPAEEVVSAAVGADVQILNRAFEPVDLTLEAGSTLTWVNMDEGVVHSLSIPGKGTVCSRVQPGERCEYTFDEAGTYSVLDLVNKFRGTITVIGAAVEPVEEAAK